MSGHSKWNNIKNKKAKGDAARSKIFTKLGREIAVAVKAGGPDINSNSKLYDVVQKAKASNIKDSEKLVAFISHGDCEEDAKYLAEKMKKEVGFKDVVIGYVGSVIGSHSGPGTLALFHFGAER